MEFCSGELNPDKRGKHLGEKPKNPNRALPGQSPTASESEAEAEQEKIEKRATFVERQLPPSEFYEHVIEDGGAGIDVVTSKSAGASISPRNRSRSSGDNFREENSGVFQTADGLLPDGLTSTSAGAQSSSSRLPMAENVVISQNTTARLARIQEQKNVLQNRLRSEGDRSASQ